VAVMAAARAAATPARSPSVASASRVNDPRTGVGRAVFASQIRAAAARPARVGMGSAFECRQSSVNRATRYVASTTSRGPPNGSCPASDASARNRKLGVASA
jgi:hypothetical protein